MVSGLVGKDICAKKVGIVTLPLHDNYGGILQAVSLYNFLILNNFDVIFLPKKIYRSKVKKIVVFVVEKIPFQNIKGWRYWYLSTKKHQEFVDRYISKKSYAIAKKGDLKKIVKNEGISTLIVGSDQVWRWSYIKHSIYEDYFLRDVGSDVRKVAYAASFGKKTWENEDLIIDIKKYLKSFYAISVREDSGVAWCKEQLSIEEVSHVVDPTLLIGREFFDEIIERENNFSVHGDFVFSYVLDRSDEKMKYIDVFCDKNGFNKNIMVNLESNIEIVEWLYYIKKSSFVITDSYHGMLFAVLFNKNFLVIDNENRGGERFLSFLNKLNLKDSLVKLGDPVQKMIEIDYCRVNSLIEDWREFSKTFLLKNL